MFFLFFSSSITIIIITIIISNKVYNKNDTITVNCFRGSVQTLCYVILDACCNAQPDGRLLCGSELRSYCFCRLWTKVHRKFAYVGSSVRSLQRRFPIDDVLLHSGDIRNQVAKLSEIAPKF